jgi:hypothetical protein
MVLISLETGVLEVIVGTIFISLLTSMVNGVNIFRNRCIGGTETDNNIISLK